MRKRPSLSEPTRAYSYHQIASAIFDEVGLNGRDKWITGIHVHVSLKFMGSFLSFSPIFFKGTAFMMSCLLPWTKQPFNNGV